MDIVAAWPLSEPSAIHYYLASGSTTAQKKYHYGVLHTTRLVFVYQLHVYELRAAFGFPAPVAIIWMRIKPSEILTYERGQVIKI